MFSLPEPREADEEPAEFPAAPPPLMRAAAAAAPDKRRPVERCGVFARLSEPKPDDLLSCPFGMMTSFAGQVKREANWGKSWSGGKRGWGGGRVSMQVITCQPELLAKIHLAASLQPIGSSTRFAPPKKWMHDTPQIMGSVLDIVREH